MDDIKYDYYQDIGNKASVASSSRKTVTKGLERTRKEIKEMNGECKTYSLNKRLTWAEFKSWPDRHKMAYLQNIYSKFNPTQTDIARLFGVSAKTIVMFFHDNTGMKSPRWYRGAHNISIAGLPSWEAFLAGESNREEEPEEQEEKEEEKIQNVVHEEEIIKIDDSDEEPKPVEEEPRNEIGFSFLKFMATGTVDDICSILKKMYLSGNYDFTIIATKNHVERMCE